MALTYIFKNILDEKLKNMQESWPFAKPVNRKTCKGYYDVIKVKNQRTFFLTLK